MKPSDIAKARTLRKTSLVARAIIRANAAVAAVDEHALNELSLYVDNTSELYDAKVAILKNMARRIQKGTYDPDLAIKGWLHWVDLGAKRYLKEIDSDKQFPKELRIELARKIATEEADRIKSGEYDSMLGKSQAPKEISHEELTQEPPKAPAAPKAQEE